MRGGQATRSRFEAFVSAHVRVVWRAPGVDAWGRRCAHASNGQARNACALLAGARARAEEPMSAPATAPATAQHAAPQPMVTVAAGNASLLVLLAGLASTAAALATVWAISAYADEN